MSALELPQNISSYWFDKVYDHTSGRDVTPNQRYFRFVIYDANSYQHLANTDLVVTFRVRPLNTDVNTTWCGDIRQMLDRVAYSADGSTVETHHHFDKWAKLDPLFWSDETIKQDGSRMGIYLFDADNDLALINI